MQKIREDVYRNLMNTPISIISQGNVNSLGDTVDGTTVIYNGYVYENAVKVLNPLGEEVLSNTQIFLRGQDIADVDINSLVSYDQVSRQHIIARKLYRGKQRALIIGILYLP